MTTPFWVVWTIIIAHIGHRTCYLKYAGVEQQVSQPVTGPCKLWTWRLFVSRPRRPYPVCVTGTNSHDRPLPALSTDVAVATEHSPCRRRPDISPRNTTPWQRQSLACSTPTLTNLDRNNSASIMFLLTTCATSRQIGTRTSHWTRRMFLGVVQSRS